MPRYNRVSIPISRDTPQPTKISLKQTEAGLDALVSDLNARGVTLDDTQTLTAKTLSAPSVTNGVRHTGVTYANRPTSAPAGTTIYITDSNTATWGATIAGGGANKVLAFYNGTNWTVAGI